MVRFFYLSVKDDKHIVAYKLSKSIRLQTLCEATLSEPTQHGSVAWSCNQSTLLGDYRSYQNGRPLVKTVWYQFGKHNDYKNW